MTADGYDFTALAAVAIAERVIGGEFEPGFQTPGGVYGADFVLSIEGTTRIDLDLRAGEQARETSFAASRRLTARLTAATTRQGTSDFSPCPPEERHDVPQSNRRGAGAAALHFPER